MVLTKKLKFKYDENHSFHFPDIGCGAGHSLVITGQSGVGKTTLLHLLAGISRPYVGDIYIDNQNICELSSKQLDQFRGKNIGLILQQSHFVEALSVLDNLIFSSWLSTGHKNKKYALDLLNELNIIDHQHKLTKQLSVGQQQRLSIARALIASPKVLLADEPTSSLDDDNTYLVANLLQSLAAKFQTALVIVSHDQRLKNIFPQHLNLQKHVS